MESIRLHRLTLTTLRKSRTALIAALDGELDRLRAGLTMLAESANPELMAARGVGIDSASTLLVTAGDNPDHAAGAPR